MKYGNLYKLIIAIVLAIPYPILACVDYTEAMRPNIINSTKMKNEFIYKNTYNYGVPRLLLLGSRAFEVSGWIDPEGPGNSILRIKKHGNPTSLIELAGQASSFFTVNSKPSYVVVGTWENDEHLCTGIFFDSKGRRKLRISAEYIQIKSILKDSIMFFAGRQQEKPDEKQTLKIKLIHKELSDKSPKIPFYTELHNDSLSYDEMYFFKNGDLSSNPSTIRNMNELKSAVDSYVDGISFSVSRSHIEASSAVRLLVKTNNKASFCKMVNRLSKEQKDEYQLELLWEFWSGYLKNEIETIRCE